MSAAWLDSVSRAVRQLSLACGFLAALCLAAACLVVCELVFVRYVLEGSTIWQGEFVLYAIVAATLIGSPYVLATRGHVSVDLLAQFLGPTGRRIQALAAATLGIAFCAVLAASGWRYFAEAWSEGWVTESVWAPPLWIVLLPLPFGTGVLTLQYLVDVIDLARGAAPRDGGGASP
jgi:TRAP-type C4-dicarboxylate transport system permease small subunit